MYEWQPPVPGKWSDLGFVNLSLDADTFARRQTLRTSAGRGRAVPCLGLALFGKSQGLSDEWFAEWPLRLDGRPVPVDAEGRLRINYVGPAGSVPTIALADVLDAARGRAHLDVDFTGAVVVIGVTAAGDSDSHATPYLNQSLAWIVRSAWLQRKSELMSGAEIHANVVATLADREFITTPWWLSTGLVLALTGLFLGAAFARLSLGWGILLALGHHVLWRAFALAAFWWGNYHVANVAVLVLGVTVYGVTFVLRWRWMRRMLGMVKSEAIAQAMEADPARLELIGEERVVSVLFSDIRNFTPFSEAHSPREVVALLNEYFTAVVPQIEREGGTIAQYSGDGLMVVFGAPAPQPDDALRAVRAAVAMVRRVHELEARWKALGAEGFRIGVGVHRGRAVMGAVGSPQRLDYTAHGDTVNTASRLESGNKELGTEILISAVVLDALPEHEKHRLRPALRAHTLTVKGKQQPVHVYSIFVPPGQGDSQPAPCAEQTTECHTPFGRTH